MTRVVQRILGIAIVVFALGTSLCAKDGRASSRQCSLWNTTGDWAFTASGKTVDGVEIKSIGKITIAKDGSITGHGWQNIGGVAFGDGDLTGTVSVNSDCTSTSQFDGIGTAHCIIYADRTKMSCVYEAPGVTTVSLERIIRP